MSKQIKLCHSGLSEFQAESKLTRVRGESLTEAELWTAEVQLHRSQDGKIEAARSEHTTDCVLKFSWNTAQAWADVIVGGERIETIRRSNNGPEVLSFEIDGQLMKLRQ